MRSATQKHDVIVVGGGLAGLAAANALAGDGARVTVLERRPGIGGRAYSYEHPTLHETLDSQHVVLGCCTNLVELCEQAGAAGNLRWYDELLFLEPESLEPEKLQPNGLKLNGNRTVLRPGSLPAPLHQTMSFLRAPMLGLVDKMKIATGLLEFLRGYPSSDTESFATWLRRTGQTERAIRHFWEPVVVGALNDTFDRCSTKYAGKVFHESFLRSPGGGRLGIPALPLSEFFAPLAGLAERRGVGLRTKAGADALRPLPDGRWEVRLGDETLVADAVVLAANFRETARLLTEIPGAMPAGWEHDFISAPITTVHLWFDRDVTDCDHAVLLNTRIQWMFAKSRIRRWPAERGSYLELVISASWAELNGGRQQILDAALAEAKLFFPKIREAHVMKSGVLKEARATFSVTPGLDRVRPAQATGVSGLFLAGDWTRTEWPSTMEGAVRSGRMAAGAICGDSSRFLAPELPATGLMRWLSHELH